MALEPSEPERVTTMWEDLNKSIAARGRGGNAPDAEPAAVAQCSEEVVTEVELNGEQKKERLEQWAWRVVQELRNCLQVISAQGEMLCSTMGEDELRWHKDEIQKAVSHAAEMAQRLQILAEAGLRIPKAGQATPATSSGTEPQMTAPSELACCPNTCKLLSSADRTVFWRKVPSLRGPFSVEFLNQLKWGGARGIMEARQ